jgi:alkanesulfonate monooxygenase
MGITLNWYLPTNGDSRTNLSLGNAVGTPENRIGQTGSDRSPDLAYLGQIARGAEAMGFTAALTPTGSACEDAWISTAALIGLTERLKFLVAFRPGFQSPTLAAQMAATYQRMSGGRLLLNVVTGGDDSEQRRFGDCLGKDDRYARCADFLHIVRELWSGDPVDFDGDHYTIRDATVIPAPTWPEPFFGGSSAAALPVAAAYADVYLT